MQDFCDSFWLKQILLFIWKLGGGLNIWADSYIKNVFCKETICQITAICFQLFQAVI